MYDLLLARIRAGRGWSRFEGAPGPIVILDGCSIRGVLRHLFGGRRAVPAGEVGPEFDRLRQVPRSRTYALFDDEG